MINSNGDRQDLASMKVVVDNEAKCSNSVLLLLVFIVI